MKLICHTLLKRCCAIVIGLTLAGAESVCFSANQNVPSTPDARIWTREESINYGEKADTKLTLDVFRPTRDANGAGVILIVSGGWASSRGAVNTNYAAHFLKRGYTVFAVVHGSQPPFVIPEIIPDLHRAVRFIRVNAKKYGVDANKIGVTGASSGGHLALMLGTQGGSGIAGAVDPVERESSAVQAVACFFPPTDFLNYVKPDLNAMDESVLKNFRKFIGPVPDDVTARDALGRRISPIYSVSSRMAPTLIIHGEKDQHVLVHQATSFVAAAKKAGGEAEVVIKKGQPHGWADVKADVETFADWFDEHLLKKRTAKTPTATILAATAVAELPAPYNSDKTTNHPLAPEAAAAQWKLPPGFAATVFAAEPDVRQPIAMAMDGRGRLWVAECYTYAEVRKGFDSQLRDRILIFEDADGDGRFDKRTVFMEDLQRLSSIEVGFGGVWAITSPTMVFIPDANGDDRPDGPPQVLLDGFEWQRNHHTMANGLRWGPDGWLYGRQGIQAVSTFGKPGAPEARRVKSNGGIWRYHPQRQTVEIVCDGTTNPWGMDWNEYGEGFFINTVIGHLWQIIPGAHYRRMHGSDLNPHAYEIIEQHADHVHWAAGERWNDWQKLGTTDATSAAGGGHAHTGLMFYGGDNWPDSWRGKLLTINFNGRRLNVENVTREGSGYVGKHAPDTGFSADPWFRGIDLIYGPDGGVFIADWSDTGECHDNEGVFRQSGRLYKLTHGQPTRPAIAEVARLSPQALVPLLDHQNEFYARHARRRLQEFAATGTDLAATRDLLREKFAQESDVVKKLRALWSLHASGGTDAAFLRAQLNHASEHVRTWAIRFLLDDIDAIANDKASTQALINLASAEPSSFVRLALASALQRLPLAERAALARPLMSRAEDAADHNLPQMLWYGVEPLGDSDPATLAALGAGCELPLTRRCIARRLTESREQSDAPINALLTKAASDARWQADVLAGMRDALKGERQATPPASWKMAAPAFAKGHDPKVLEHFRALGAVFADPLALKSTRATALDGSADMEIRRAALRSLIDSRAVGLREVCETVLTVRGLSATAADGLALDKAPAVADLMLVKFATIAPAERAAVLSTLVSRSAWADRVLDAIATGQLPRAELTSFHARQIRGFNDAALTRRLGEVWGVSRESDAEKLAQMSRWKNKLTPEVLKQADKTKGRALYHQVCGACHTLNGEGGKAGPELTGSGRDSLDYLLQNILDPSAAVVREFQLVTLNMKDGRALSGFIRSRTDRIVVLQTLAEAVSLSAADIAGTESSNLSLMPEGLLETLGENDVRDLIGYLMQK